MRIKINLLKDRVILYAFLFSAVWHIFWLSAVSVVVVPTVKKSVKFSNVSFLGPILDRGVLNMSVAPHESTVLEKEYVASIENISVGFEEGVAPDGYVETELDNAPSEIGDDWPNNFVISGIEGSKIEPGRNV